MKITIGFSSPKKTKLFSSLIKLFQGTKYSHIFIRKYSSFLNTEYVYQASGLSVNFINSKSFDEINDTLHAYQIDLTDKQHREFMHFAMTNAGKPYGIKQILGIVLSKFGIKSTKFNDGSDSYICSELVAKVLMDHKDLKLDKPVDMVTPKDLFEIMEKHYAFAKIK